MIMKILLGLLLLLIIIIPVMFWLKKFQLTSSPLKPASAMLMLENTENKATPPMIPISLEPIYLQKDPRWQEDTIGGSQETIGEVGCTLCCVSMALAHYDIQLMPDQLNELLKANQGYTQQGWLKWHTVSQVTRHQIRFTIPSKPRTDLIEAALRAGEPVIAKIYLWQTQPHWVLIVGKQGNDYLVKDPLGDGQSTDYLSAVNGAIQAIRIMKKN